MDDEPKQTLSLKAAYAFGARRGLEREVTDIRDMVIEWDSSYTSSLRRGYVIELFERHGLFHDFKKQHWPTGDTQTGEILRRRFLRIKSDYEAFLAGQGLAVLDDAGEEVASDEFALEAHLRDFLAKNLDRVEPGLRLYSSPQAGGIEFPVGRGRIDILAVDRADKFVVIELKLSHGRNKTLGQLLYYMGWVDQHLGQGPCRGFIIASNISDQLAMAGGLSWRGM
jgi:hypothetical protein